VPVAISLSVIGLLLGLAMIASLLFPKEVAAHDPVAHEPMVRR